MTHRPDGMSERGHSNRRMLSDIRRRMLAGTITYAEARAEAKPIIDEMNARAKELAKEYGVRFKPFSFAALMR